MHPDQALFLLHFLLPQLKSEQAVTAKIILTVPPNQVDFRPHAKCMSAFRLAWHLVLCELWLVDAVIHRQFAEDVMPRPSDVQTCPGIAAWYEQQFTQRMPLLESLSGEELTTPVDYLGLRNDPAVAYLNIAIRHSVHHRGQLSTYLRAMGENVPAIYVESADEPWPPDPAIPAAENPQPPPAF